ncbi:MAG: hypothetical protein Tsb0010_01370 [Parvularculaceae bacterium]
MTLGILIEILVAALLLVTIGYCAVLDRKLHALRSGQDGLRDVIRELNKATDQAQRSISQLKEQGAGAGAKLEGAIGRAKTLADELSFLVEAGDRIADRLAETAGGDARSGPVANEDPPHEDIETAAARILAQAKDQDGDWSENVREKIKTALGGVR